MVKTVNTSDLVQTYIKQNPGQSLSEVRSVFSCNCGGLTDVEWSLVMVELLDTKILTLDHERRLWHTGGDGGG